MQSLACVPELKIGRREWQLHWEQFVRKERAKRFSLKKITVKITHLSHLATWRQWDWKFWVRWVIASRSERWHRVWSQQTDAKSKSLGNMGNAKSSLWSYWKWDEGKNTCIEDSSGSGKLKRLRLEKSFTPKERKYSPTNIEAEDKKDEEEQDGVVMAMAM